MIVWAILIIVSFLGLSRSLWTPDEPREAEISREMLLHPSVIPTLNGKSFVEKPPLYYWLVAAAFRVTGGPSVRVARGVSALLSLLTLVVLYAWTARAASRAVALVAVALLGTSVQFLLTAHWVLLDPLLMLCCSLAAWAGWEVVEGKRPALFLSIFYVALVLALWTKGPIGPVLLGAGVVAYSFVARGERPIRKFRPWLGIAILAGGVASIGAAIYATGGMDALWTWGWVNQVERVTSPQGTGHQRPIYYYLPSLVVVVLPWLIPFLDVFTKRFWDRASATSGLRRYCGALVIGGFAILSLAATKRTNYLMPLFAPLFLLLALAVDDRISRFTAGIAEGRWVRLSRWAQSIFLAILVVVPGVAVSIYLRSVTVRGGIAIALGVGVAIALVVATTRRRLRAIIGWSGIAAAVFAAGALVVAMPALEPKKDFTPFVSFVDQQVPRGQPIAAVGADETLNGIIPFLTSRRVIDLSRDELATTDANYIVVQSDTRKGSDLPSSAGFEILRRTVLGNSRELTLWRRM